MAGGGMGRQVPGMSKHPVVGVMGSGCEEHWESAGPLGGLLARLGTHLLTGGGEGVMGAVSRAFVRAKPRPGLCLAVLPGEIENSRCDAPPGYPNEFAELVVRTHLPARGTDGDSLRSRNWINALTSDALVFLPGGAGTESEARIARQLGKPAISFGGVASPAGIDQAVTLSEVERFLRRELKIDC